MARSNAKGLKLSKAMMNSSAIEATDLSNYPFYYYNVFYERNINIFSHEMLNDRKTKIYNFTTSVSNYLPKDSI